MSPAKFTWKNNSLILYSANVKIFAFTISLGLATVLEI